MNKFAVYLDYQKHGDSGITTVPLGNSLSRSKRLAELWLGVMIYGDLAHTDMWEVSERDLPRDYKFMTYYVGAYDES